MALQWSDDSAGDAPIFCSPGHGMGSKVDRAPGGRPRVAKPFRGRLVPRHEPDANAWPLGDLGVSGSTVARPRETGPVTGMKKRQSTTGDASPSRITTGRSTHRLWPLLQWVLMPSTCVPANTPTESQEAVLIGRPFTARTGIEMGHRP